MKNILKFAVGLLLFPVVVALWWELLRAASGAAAAQQAAALPFFGGFLGYALLWLWSRAGRGPAARRTASMLRGLYVLGHESAHAAAAWAFGGHVYEFKASPEGGHVKLSKSNAFVALAPYLAPVPALAALLVFRVAVWIRPGWNSLGAVAGMMGVGLAFHLLETLASVGDVSQPDLHMAGGVLFSISLIGLGNAVMTLAALKAFFPHSVAFLDVLRRCALDIAGLWTFVASQGSAAPAPAK